MKTYEAVVLRVQEICAKQGKSVCDICLTAGMSPSSIYALIKGRTRISKVNTIQRFSEGVGMTLAEFFTSDYFSDLAPEE
jgi:transcriptional regulator with XRE-family HTH domain